MRERKTKGFAEHTYTEWNADGYHYLHYTRFMGGKKVKDFTCRMPLNKYYGENTASDWETVDAWDELEESA